MRSSLVGRLLPVLALTAATPLTAQNDFTMPALMTPEATAEAMLAGFARGDFEIHFPRRFTLVLKLLRFLPRRLYFALIHRLTGL